MFTVNDDVYSVLLVLNMSSNRVIKRTPAYWKLDNSLLFNETLNVIIKNKITEYLRNDFKYFLSGRSHYREFRRHCEVQRLQEITAPGKEKTLHIITPNKTTTCCL